MAVPPEVQHSTAPPLAAGAGGGFNPCTTDEISRFRESQELQPQKLTRSRLEPTNDAHLNISTSAVADVESGGKMLYELIGIVSLALSTPWMYKEGMPPDGGKGADTAS
jgi:hypothetical protein